MHIPEGFISPQTYIPAYGIASVLWGASMGGIRRKLDEKSLPLIAAIGGLAFVVSSISFPLPGGSSIHLTGLPLLALLFGYRISFVAYSLMLLIQAVVFGMGGLTTFPVSALALGFVGSVTTVVSARLLKWLPRSAMVFCSTLLAIVMAAMAVSLILGLQPLIAADSSGHPLYFPFGIKQTMMAMVVPHIALGAVEGAINVVALQYYSGRFQW